MTTMTWEEPMPLLPSFDQLITHAVTLVVGGGTSIAAWLAYRGRATDRAEDRLTRFETRLDTRVATLEAEMARKDQDILALTKQLGAAEASANSALAQIKEMAENEELLYYYVGQLRAQNGMLKARLKDLGDAPSDASDSEILLPREVLDRIKKGQP